MIGPAADKILAIAARPGSCGRSVAMASVRTASARVYRSLLCRTLAVGIALVAVSAGGVRPESCARCEGAWRQTSRTRQGRSQRSLWLRV